MKTIEEMQAQLKQICAELDALKAAQTSETPETNFKEIAAKASRYPITGHPLAKEDEHTKEMYMLMLMSVIVLDSDKYTESFMTFYRIAAGMGYSGNAEELMLKAQTMKFETLDEITRLFGKDDKRLMLLLECMLIAAQFDKGKRKAMEYIAELASLMNITKEQITFLSNLARVVLTQDLKEYKSDILNTYGELFDCYIDVFDKQFKYFVLSAKLCQLWPKNNHSGGLIRSINVEKNQIVVSYSSHIKPLGGFGVAASEDLPKETINTKGKIVNYLFMNMTFFSDRAPGYSCFFSKKEFRDNKNLIPMFPFGIASNHPLAHSKSVKRYLSGEIPNHISFINEMYDNWWNAADSIEEKEEELKEYLCNKE